MSTAAEEQSNDALTHFDFLRGIAAVAVVIGHVRGPFFVEYGQVQSPSAFLKALYLVTGLGHQAVVVFFVLSGFFVGSSVLASRHRFSWPHYLLRRLTRLWVVLLPALLITALLDQSGAALFGYEGVYGGIGDGLNFDDIRRSGTVAMFFANLFFLQQVIVTIPTFGANGPLWSLSYELWAYVLFPLLVQAATSSVPTLRRALFVLAAVGILWAGGERLRFCFPLWLLGALAAWAWRRIDLPVRGRGVVRWAAVAGFLVALLASRLRLMGTQDRDDALLGIATTALVLALLATGRPEGDSAPARVYHRVAKHLAGFSYTMYLVHFPPVAVINAALVHPIRWPADARHMGYAGLIAVAAIWLFAYPFSRLTEAHTERVRRRVGQLLGLELQRGTVVASADRAPGE